jgi:hypothetical protein
MLELKLSAFFAVVIMVTGLTFCPDWLEPHPPILFFLTLLG